MGTDRESDIETALAAAVANAALEGIVIEPDEQDLIRLRQSGELSQALAKELPAIISPRRAPEPRQDTPDLRAPTRPVEPRPPADPPTAPPPAPRRGR